MLGKSHSMHSASNQLYFVKLHLNTYYMIYEYYNKYCQ